MATSKPPRKAARQPTAPALAKGREPAHATPSAAMTHPEVPANAADDQGQARRAGPIRLGSWPTSGPVWA